MINDDDDFEIINGKRVLKDGRTFRTSVTMLDSLQQSIAAHRPGFRYADTDDDDAHQEAQDARDEYVTWLGGAHKTPVVNADTDEPYRPTSLADARAEAERAYDERSEWLRDAHKGQQP